jgi:hypothetical protein
MPPSTIKVDRSTRWGNPFVIGEPVDVKRAQKWGFTSNEFVADNAEQAVAHFEQALRDQPAAIEAVKAALRGHNLACWCQPLAACHADVLIRIANE